MYRSLLRLKALCREGGDVDSLGLFFEVNKRDSTGYVSTIELVPGGSAKKGISHKLTAFHSNEVTCFVRIVTSVNCREYIHQLANYKLNREVAEQSRAFQSGLREIVPLDLLRLFSAQEVQLLIGGDQRPLDIQDLKRHTAYGGGYHESQPYIQLFWAVLESLTAEQQGDFLKFVTSCSRPPLLGFGQLTPSFAIQKVPLYIDENQRGKKLPTASTCMNLFKLPPYETVEELLAKLLLAISSNTGFELT
jgi:ubiquitin-protein ligase E3 C